MNIINIFLFLNMNTHVDILKIEHEKAKIKYPKLFIKKTIKKMPTISENFNIIQYILNICIKNIENYIKICNIDKIGWG